MSRPSGESQHDSHESTNCCNNTIGAVGLQPDMSGSGTQGPCRPQLGKMPGGDRTANPAGGPGLLRPRRCDGSSPQRLRYGAGFGERRAATRGHGSLAIAPARQRYGVSVRMQTPLSNALRLVAGAACIVSTLLSVCALARAVQVDGSGTWTGNGVLVMPSASMSSSSQPVCAAAASAPIRNRTWTVSPANAVPKLCCGGARRSRGPLHGSATARASGASPGDRRRGCTAVWRARDGRLAHRRSRERGEAGRRRPSSHGSWYSKQGYTSGRRPTELGDQEAGGKITG